MKIRFPLLDRAPHEALGASALALTTAQLFSWRQSAGAFGGLHLDGCTGGNSALSRRYHGQTITILANIHRGARGLARGADGKRWRHLADCLAAQMLWLQSSKGGFVHASSEGEPTYDSYWSCPIHQMTPMLALLDHHEDQPAGAPLRAEIEFVLARHVDWFARFWWKRGSEWRRPLTSAGWCGVTSQDLVVVAALARYGQVIGNWLPYETYGKPALNTFLGPRYHHAATGLFERGDRSLFTERCVDMIVIHEMLHTIQTVRPDPRIPRVLKRLNDTLADAIFVDDQGAHHMAWGVDDAATTAAKQRVWMRGRLQVGEYPALLTHLHRHADKTDVELREKIAGLEKTVASYLFSDGTLPTMLEAGAPLFAIVPSAPSLVGLWLHLIARNPEGLAWNDIPTLPGVSRRCGPVHYVANASGWMIHEEGLPALRGIKQLSHGVLRPGENLANCNYEPPADPDFHEEVATLFAEMVAAC